MARKQPSPPADTRSGTLDTPPVDLPPDAVIKTSIARETRRNGDIYVYERQTCYDKEKGFTRILGRKLLGKIPKGSTEMIPTSSKYEAGKTKQTRDRTRVDLNCDMGESFGTYRLGDDEYLLPHISSANIACGLHAGDPIIMARTVKACRDAGVAVGAHPSFPDLQGFGRRSMNLTPEEIKAYVQYQLGALQAFASACGVTVQHCKPHGALYNMAAKDYALASAIATAIAEVDRNIILLGQAGSFLIKAGRNAGLRVANEVFADRAYRPDGSLVPRSEPASVLHDPEEVAQRVIRMVKEGKVTASDGTDLAIQADSICVHGDNPEAEKLVLTIRAALVKRGISIVPIRQII